MRELLKWMAHYRLDGGFGLDWVRSARMTAIITSALTGKGDPKNERRWTYSYREGDEYLGKHRRQQSEQETATMLEGLLSRIKGREESQDGHS